MTDGFVRNDDDRFGPLTEAERSTGDASIVVPEDDETAILNPVATVQRRVRHPRLGIASKIWRYMPDTENVSFLVCRFDKPSGKKEFGIYSPWRRADGSEHWRWKRPPAPLPLYKLPDIVARADAPVMICEGEKATDDAARIFPDHITTCWQGGAGNVRFTDYGPLAGRQVTFWPDNDQPGRAAASELITTLLSLGCKVDVIDAEQLSATVPGNAGEKREPVLKWDAADAGVEWPNLDALREVISRHITTAKAPPAYRSHGRFKMDETGLYAPSRRAKEADTRTLVAGPFEIIGRTRSPNGHGWGRLARWQDGDGRPHTRLVLDTNLHGTPAQLVAGLVEEGLMVELGRGGDLADYLNGCEDLPKVLSVDRTGWHDVSGRHVFALPDAAFGDIGDEPVILTGTSTAAFASVGNLNDWGRGVGILVRGHSRQMLMVSAAFASALLQPLRGEGGGISIHGPSSTGKSTTIEAAASVWGNGATDGYVHTWRSTSNGLEAVAAMHCDLPLCLDELGQADGRDVGSSVYQLFAGAGKVRATKEGTLKAPQSSRTFVLSTGELRLRDKLQEEGRRPMAGQLVRLLEVPADAGLGFGAFDHGGVSGDAKDLAHAIEHAARTHYGTAGPEFVRRLIEKGEDEVVSEAEAAIAAFAREHVPPGADGQVRRAGDAFALIGYAGELATTLGVLPWQPGEALGAAVTCFEAWLDDRGSTDPYEVMQAIERVTGFIELHGATRFERLPRAGDASIRMPVGNLAGYWRGEGPGREWLIHPSIWKAEVLKGLDHNAAAKALRDKGILRAKEKYQLSVKVAGESTWFYAVRLSVPVTGGDEEPVRAELLPF